MSQKNSLRGMLKWAGPVLLWCVYALAVGVMTTHSGPRFLDASPAAAPNCHRPGLLAVHSRAETNRQEHWQTVQTADIRLAGENVWSAAGLQEVSCGAKNQSA